MNENISFVVVASATDIPAKAQSTNLSSLAKLRGRGKKRLPFFAEMAVVKIVTPA
jgi:hypothetical protein